LEDIEEKKGGKDGGGRTSVIRKREGNFRRVTSEIYGPLGKIESKTDMYSDTKKKGKEGIALFCEKKTLKTVHGQRDPKASAILDGSKDEIRTK